MDAVACVLVPEDVQEDRVMARGTMTREQFLAIRAKQMPAGEKAAKADYVIVTDTPEHAEAQVAEVLADIRRKIANA
jgi:dephospho-CoA kinase